MLTINQVRFQKLLLVLIAILMALFFLNNLFASDPRGSGIGKRLENSEAFTTTCGTYIVYDDNENNNLSGIPDYDWWYCVFNDDPLEPIEFEIPMTGSLPTSSAKLLLLCWDVDETSGEVDEVYFNGYFIGTLTGADSENSTTILNIPNLSWINSGNNLVQIYVDVNNIENPTWCVELMQAQLLIDGGCGGSATCRYIMTDSPSYDFGALVTATTEVDTSAASQNVVVETDIYDPNGTNIAGDSWSYTTYGNANDPISFYLWLPFSNAGTYTVESLIFDGTSGEFQSSCSTDILVGATMGSLEGNVGMCYIEGLYPLDGTGVSGTVTATDVSGGGSYSGNIISGYYYIGNLPPGTYNVTATITYRDYIQYDAELLGLGCLAPSGGYILKTVTSIPQSVFVSDVSYADLCFQLPLVMVHGIFNCYEKWYSDNQSDPDFYNYWDNYSRQESFISFTPNYEWWGSNSSWIERGDEVLNQVTQDMADLSSWNVAPFVLIGHDMGGLLVRVLTSPFYYGNMIMDNMMRAYIIGTPNSGADFNVRLGQRGLLGPNSIIRYFNEAYPDFGNFDIYGIGGNNGWWKTRNNDRFVSLYSAFTITRIACRSTNNDCVAYPALILPNGIGHVFYYEHNELGSPESTDEILQNIILDTWMSASPLKKSRQETPVGGVGWGTVGRTSNTMGGNVSPVKGETSQDYSFTVSKCDGMAVLVTVTSGSGDFKVVAPSGTEFPITDGIFQKTAPSAGTWNLRVIPGGSGVTFDAVTIDNSIFGIKAYLITQSVTGGVNDTLRVDQDGDWSSVTINTIQALLYDRLGNLIQTLTLTPSGNYFSVDFTAPSTPGTYQFVVKADGNYNGQAFSRVEFETLNVLPASHIFSGSFSDIALDQDLNGKSDAISFTANLNITEAGYYTISADLTDSNGNFLSHSTTSITASGSGSYPATLIFSLSGINCGQIGSPFQVSGLKILDANYLQPLDDWGSSINTQPYNSSGFTCTAGTPSPVPDIVTPESGVRGRTLTIAISGKNFQSGATLSFDSGVTVDDLTWYNNRVVVATITISAIASLGAHDITITNPDGKTGSLLGSFTINEDDSPVVEIASPIDGAILGGTIDVTAGASDDIGVASVVFELDGVQKSTVTSFPFIWSWDTSTTLFGAHTIKVTATDTSGHQSTDQINVTTVQPPGVSSMVKKGKPFRFIVSGSNLQSGVKVYIDGELWSTFVWKSTSKVVIKGGSALKAKVPKGVDTQFRFVNPDLGETTITWHW